VVTKPDGSRIMAPVYHFATRSDGSTVFVSIRSASTAQAPIRILQLATGFRGYVSDANQQKYMKASVALSPQDVRAPSSLCKIGGQESAISQEQISGFRAEKVSIGNITSWYSLDHGCALVKQHVDWGDGGMTDKYLVILSPGEPDASLFSVPSNYADVPESTFLQP